MPAAPLSLVPSPSSLHRAGIPETLLGEGGRNTDLGLCGTIEPRALFWAGLCAFPLSEASLLASSREEKVWAPGCTSQP